MKFFNLDLHISVIEDIKIILESIGHVVDSWSVSGHAWVFNRQISNVDIVNQNTWKNLDQKMCDRFYERYKDELEGYDGFIACYPPAFATLYEKFDKPIFTVVATRYEHPFSNSFKKWNWLDNKLISMIDNKQIIPISNNRYDKFYCEHFLDREFTHIPNICDYTNAKYDPELEPIVSGRMKINDYKHISDLGRFNWGDLYKHRAIVHIPYNVSIMSIFEQYTANVPLFFPSAQFCNSINGAMSELLFHPNCRINNHAEENIGLSDFYDEEWMPYIQIFNSIEDLSIQLNSIDLKNISNSMSNFNECRFKKIIKMWENIIDENN